MSPLKSILATLLALNLAILTAADPFHWADNVCNLTVPVKKEVIDVKPVQYEIKVQSMCGVLPCVKTRTETRWNQSIKTSISHIGKPTCCPGYAETPSRRCSPVCSEPCGPAGKCVAPDVCLCQIKPTSFEPGFSGNTCRRFTCPSEDRWGKSCQHKCQTECMTNMYCSADTGKCVCEPGWYGVNCTNKCSPDDDFPVAECQFISQIPPINEPDANLMPDLPNADALRLSSQDSQEWATSNYIIGSLSVISLVLLVAFLIVKRRYESVRNELYYATAASVGSGSGGLDQSQSDYSTSTYYSTGHPPSSILPDPATSKKLGNHLSFSAATRNILAGGLIGQPTNAPKIHMFSPKTESHLITSQKRSKQNIYAEVSNKSDNSLDIANRARAQTPDVTQRAGDCDDYDNIYQVPKRQSTDTTMNSSITSQDDSNIYEELRPRNSTGNL